MRAGCSQTIMIKSILRRLNAKHRRARRWQKKKEAEKAEKDKFRDRAKERRDGTNADYADTNEIVMAAVRSPPAWGAGAPGLIRLRSVRA